MKQNKQLRKDIFGIWLMLVIGFGNLILIVGTHLLNNWFKSSGDLKGFSFFGFDIYGNVIIDSLYALIIVLQVTLMYLILKNRIKIIIGNYYEKQK